MDGSSRTRSAAADRRRTRTGAIAVLLVVLLVVPALPASAAGWPSVFNAYGRFDGTTFNDPIDVEQGNAYGDLSSGSTVKDVVGPVSSTYVASDGTDLLVRFRLRQSPGSTASAWDTSKGGLTGLAYVVQLSVNGTHVASVGLDGKSPSVDYVYVAPVDSIITTSGTYSATTPRVVSSWNSTTQDIPGARLTSAGNPAAPAETFLDFRVPIADITLVAPSVTVDTPLQFFFGTSAAANLTTINKDWMAGQDGTTCTMLGCAELTIGPSDVALAWTATPTSVSGPNPPTVGTESRYDLTVRASNTGLNALTEIVVLDELPPHVAVVSATSASGTIGFEGGTVTWKPAGLAPGQRVEATLRVAVRPDGSWHNQAMTLSNGPAATALDAAAERTSAASLPAVAVSPVGGIQASSDFAVAMTGPATATAGDDLAYAIGVHNHGPASATPRITVALPQGTTLESAAGTGWTCTPVAAGAECSQASAVAVGAAAPVLTVTTATVADLTGSVVATATAAPVSGSDQNSSNDTAAVTTVLAAPEQPTEEPTPAPTEDVTEGPTEETTETPTEVVSEAPTEETSETPTEVVSEAPTEETSEAPTEVVSEAPTEETSEAPTEVVSETPTEEASEAPTENVTEAPTEEPTDTPTDDPTEEATGTPTSDPSDDPSEQSTEDHAPLAVDDQAGGTMGEAVTVDVLANDSAPGSELDPASVTVVVPMQHGQILAVSSVTGAVQYRPDATYEGADEFTYRVCNRLGRCATATVRTATPPVDLEVTVVRTGPALSVGDTATYDVTVTNLGPRHAEGPLTLRLSAPAGLSSLSASGSGWTLHAEAANAQTARVAQVSVAATSTTTLYWPGGLAVNDRSSVALSGTVTGAAGTDVQLVAEVSGPDIELEYANNESSAIDVVALATDPPPGGDSGDPDAPADPDEPTDPVDPIGPDEPTEPDDGTGNPDVTPPPDGDTGSGGGKRPPPEDGVDGTGDRDDDGEFIDPTRNDDSAPEDDGRVETISDTATPTTSTDVPPRALAATGGGVLQLLAVATVLGVLGMAMLRKTDTKRVSQRRR